MIPMRIGTLQTVLPMYVMKNLPMPMLLGTPLIDRYVESIKPQNRQIKLVEGRVVAVLNNHDKAAIVRVTEITYLAPFWETVVRCRTSRVDLSQIRVLPKRKDGMAVVTNGVIETSDGFVNMRVANFSKTERGLPKHFSLAVASSVESISVVEQSSAMTVETWLQEIDLSHLKPQERIRIQELLRKYSCLFQWYRLGADGWTCASH
jgi:hypothetical protein